MLKIASGVYRSREIDVPMSVTVPTKSIVRTAIGNALGDFLLGANVLDLFAGSGALGIECLSRGASKCDFVDSSSEAEKIVEMNLAKLKETKGRAFCVDFSKFIEETDAVYDVVLLDPPYAKKEFYGQAIESLFLNNRLNESAVIVIEYEGKEPDYDMGRFQKIKRYRYGRTSVSMLWRQK